MEQRGRVGVPGIDLIPEGGHPPILEIACNQRRLASARRTAYPHERPAAVLIEQREQSLARHDAKQPRSADLCKRWSPFHPVWAQLLASTMRTNAIVLPVCAKPTRRARRWAVHGLVYFSLYVPLFGLQPMIATSFAGLPQALSMRYSPRSVIPSYLPVPPADVYVPPAPSALP